MSAMRINASTSVHAPRSAPEDAPIVSVLACIDFRYSKYLTRVMKNLGHASSYFEIKAAGASFPFYYDYLETRDECQCVKQHEKTIGAIAAGALANLDTALNFITQSTLYIIDHQDCAAFKAYTACTGKSCINYPSQPSSSQESKDRELYIHAEALVGAKSVLSKSVRYTVIILGIIDQAGAFGVYDENTKLWSVQVSGESFDPHALFSKNNVNLGSMCHIRCPLTVGRCQSFFGGFPPTPPMAPMCSPRIIPRLFSEMAIL